MNGVDSSFEALAFIPLNLNPLLSAAYNNLWACVALLTAVFSLWRLRTFSPKTTSSSSSHISLSPPPSTTTNTTSFQVVDEYKRDKVDEKDEEIVVLTKDTFHNDKFFTVYYENDDDNDDGDQMDDGDHHHYHGHHGYDADEDEYVVIKRWGSTGSTLEMMMSSSPSPSSSPSSLPSSPSSSSSEYDLGWYSYQDRKVINGSVVRLWGDERESGCGSPRGCRRRCFLGVTTQLVLA